MGRAARSDPGIPILSGGSLAPAWTFSRTQSAGVQSTYRPDPNGPWVSYAANAPRLSASGILIEGTRVNSLPNPRGEGASGSTPPTGATLTADRGLAHTFTPTVRNGVSGFIWAGVGTPNATSGTFLHLEAGETSTAGRAYVMAAFVELVSGSVAPLSVLSLRNSTELVGLQKLIVPTSTMQRVESPQTAAGTLYRTSIGFAFANTSTPVSFSLFIGWPTREMDVAFASTPILPPVGVPGASTRGADVLTASLSALGVSGSALCGVYGAVNVPLAGIVGSDRNVAQVDGGADTARFRIRNISGTQALTGGRVTGGVAVDPASAGDCPPGVTVRWGVALGGNGRIASFVSNGINRAAAGGPTSGLTTLRLGNNAAGTAPLFGELFDVVVRPSVIEEYDLPRIAAPGSPVYTFLPGVRVMSEGDSILDFGNRWNPTGLALETQNDSEVAWADTLAGGARIKYAIWQDGTNIRGANAAVAGSKSSDVLTRINADIAAATAGGVEVMIVSAGTNGMENVTAAMIIADLEEILVRLRAANIMCILGTVRPRKIETDPLAGWVADDVRWARTYEVNAWVRAQASRPGVRVWDPFNDLRKPGATEQLGEARTNTLVDDVHPGPYGAFLGAKSLALVINELVAPGIWLPPPLAAGNAWSNPTMSGSVALSAAGATGNIATSWTCSRATGSTASVVCSKGGDGAQEMVFTPGVGGPAVDVFYLTHSPTNVLDSILASSADTYWQLALDLDVSAWDGFAYVSPHTLDAGGSVNYKTLSNTVTDVGGVYEAWRGVAALTPPLKRAAWTSIRARLAVGVYVGNHPITGLPITGTGTVKVRRAWFVQTENPEVAFPL